MVNLHDFEAESTKVFIRLKFKSLHKTLNRSYLAKEYYFEILKLFNEDDAEFFSKVITDMILSYRGFHMPTKDDFMVYINKRNAAASKAKKAAEVVDDEPPLTDEQREEFSKMINDFKKRVGA